MRTLFRIIMILSVASLVATGMYFAVQNETVRGWLGAPSDTMQSVNAGAENANGNASGMTRPVFNGAQGERGAHDGSDTPSIVRNLGIFGGMILGVMLVQQTASRLAQRQRPRTA